MREGADKLAGKIYEMCQQWRGREGHVNSGGREKKGHCKRLFDCFSCVTHLALV